MNNIVNSNVYLDHSTYLPSRLRHEIKIPVFSETTHQIFSEKLGNKDISSIRPLKNKIESLQKYIDKLNQLGSFKDYCFLQIKEARAAIVVDEEFIFGIFMSLLVFSAITSISLVVVPLGLLAMSAGAIAFTALVGLTGVGVDFFKKKNKAYISQKSFFDNKIRWLTNDIKNKYEINRGYIRQHAAELKKTVDLEIVENTKTVQTLTTSYHAIVQTQKKFQEKIDELNHFRLTQLDFENFKTNIDKIDSQIKRNQKLLNKAKFIYTDINKKLNDVTHKLLTYKLAREELNEAYEFYLLSKPLIN